MNSVQKGLLTALFVASVGMAIYEAHRASRLSDQVLTLEQKQTPFTEQIQLLQQERDAATNRLALMAEAHTDQLESQLASRNPQIGASAMNIIENRSGEATGRTPSMEIVLQTNAVSTPATLASRTNQLPYTEEQLELYRCANQMFAINMATERWAANHNGLMPNDLSELRDFLAPMTLVCPSARPTSLTTRWQDFDVKDITYQIRSSTKGAQWDFKIPDLGSPVTMTYLSCPIHNIQTMNWARPPGIRVNQVFHAPIGQ